MIIDDDDDAETINNNNNNKIENKVECEDVREEGKNVTTNKKINDDDMIMDGFDNDDEVAFDDDDDDLDGSMLDQLPIINDDDDDDVGIDKIVGNGDDNDVSDDKDSFKVYWLDAYEDHYKQPGTVYLFGKSWKDDEKRYVSCCLVVKSIWRKVYLLPRAKRVVDKEVTDQAVSFIDVYNEFNDTVSVQHNITKFKTKKTTKLYAFEKENVPVTADYLEIHYPADQPQLPLDLQGETFSAVFGTTTHSLENLVIGRALKGPSWLKIRKYVVNRPPISWCQMEVSVGGVEDIQVCLKQEPPPPLVVVTLSLISFNNPLDRKNEIIGVCLLVNNKFTFDKRNKNNKSSFQQHFTAICKSHNCVFPFDLKEKLNLKMKGMKVEMVANERGLLNLLICRLHKIDPDVLLGHDITSFDLDLLLHRLHIHKVPNWSRIGRLNRKNQILKTTTQGGNSRSVMASCAGRLVCDIKTSAMELVRSRSYDLGELASQILKKKICVRPEVVNVSSLFSSSKQLAQLIHTTITDTTVITQISTELNILPLALQITNICGNLMSRTLVGGRSERNEFLLLHAFNNNNYIVPDKIFNKKKVDDGGREGKKKADYAGGLVLQPKKGFYDQFILLLDFNSLYPSIIQEFNICFTTVSFNQPINHHNNNNNKENNNKNNINKNETINNISSDDYDESFLPEAGLPAGVLPTEIRKLVESRRHVRGLMKGLLSNSDLYTQYDIRQKALKLTANSMYGCLGFSMSRFYARKLAAMITGKGREILLKTKDLVESMNIEVIYGDTDSIMVNTRLVDYNDVMSLGNKIKNEVNKLYRLLEIDIDGVYKSLLLLKKKKYAGCMVKKTADGDLSVVREMKGLDIVRRDWCPLAQQIGSGVLDEIFSGEARELVVERIHSRLVQVAQQAKDRTLAKNLFFITKQLAKNPEEYKEREGLPHVQVAYRLNQAGAKKCKAGDVIYYVICENGTTDPATRRAFHPEEEAKSDSLTIDINYYLSQQVHPVVSRLVDCIDGTDACHIADCLGLDSKSYRQAPVHSEGVEEEEEGVVLSVEDRFRDCERFRVVCLSCSAPHEIEAPYVTVLGLTDRYQCSLLKCINPGCNASPLQRPHRLKNMLSKQIRGHMRSYNEGWLSCDDVACNHRTRRLPLHHKQRQPICPTCFKGALKLEYSDSCLYTQLSFLSYIFDLDHSSFKGKSLMTLSDEEREVVDDLKAVVDDKVKRSAYAHIDLSKLFSSLLPVKSL